MTTPSGRPRSPLLTAVFEAGFGHFVHSRDAAAGTPLFDEADPAAGLFEIESGAVRLFASDPEGREQTIRLVEPGQSFNEVPFFDCGLEPASAEAIEDSRIFVLPQARRELVLASVPSFAVIAAEQLAARLRHTVALASDLSFRQVTGRVALVLLQQVEPRRGVGAGSGGRSLTQREIADMVGTSREVVARSLRRLQDEGLIRVARGRIELLDGEALARHE